MERPEAESLQRTRKLIQVQPNDSDVSDESESIHSRVNDLSDRYTKLERAVLLLGVVPISIGACMLLSFLVGADANFDLKNYHFLNGFLYLHNAILKDTTGTLQSFLDPYISILYYLLISKTTPIVANLSLAFIQSFNVILVFILAREVFLRMGLDVGKRIVASFVVSSLVLAGPDFFSEIGTTMGDSTLSVPILLALVLVVWRTRGSAKPSRAHMVALAIAGLIVGFTCTMKLTNAVYAIALAVTVLICEIERTNRLRKAIRSVILYCFMTAIGFTVTYAPLGLMLWHQFHNPVFPYFNGVFHSPFMVSQSISDSRWYPASALGYLTMPFQFAFRHTGNAASQSQYFGMEIPFRTLYFAILVPLSILYMMLAAVRFRIEGKQYFVQHSLVVFLGFSYLLWAHEFSYYRYLQVLEILAPLFIAMELLYIVPIVVRNRVIFFSSLLVLVLVGLYSLPDSNWGRIAYAKTYFGITANQFKDYRNDEVILGEYPLPLGYTVPYFPTSDQFITLPPSNQVLYYKPYLDWYLSRFTESRRPIVYEGMYTPGYTLLKQQSELLLADFGVKIDVSSCSVIDTYLSPIAVCKASRV